MKPQLISLILAIGALGGAAMVLSEGFLFPGKRILIPAAFLVVAVTAVIRTERIVAFGPRFLVALGGFSVSVLTLYVWVVLQPSIAPIPLLGHGWRLGMAILLCAAVSLPVARLAKPNPPAAEG